MRFGLIFVLRVVLPRGWVRKGGGVSVLMFESAENYLEGRGNKVEFYLGGMGGS